MTYITEDDTLARRAMPEPLDLRWRIKEFGLDMPEHGIFAYVAYYPDSTNAPEGHPWQAYGIVFPDHRHDYWYETHEQAVEAVTLWIRLVSS